MSTKETLDSLSCFNDWKEICDGLDSAATYAPSTDRYYIKEAILHTEGIQSIANELAYHVRQLEIELEELKRLNEWVSVEDRLPVGDACHVMVACEGGKMDFTIYHSDRFTWLPNTVYSRKHHGKLSGFFELAHEYGYVITHWKQITPPQLKEGE